MKISGDLLNKINNITMGNKSFDYLGIKALYTDIPVEECIKRFKNHFKKTNITLPLPVNKKTKFSRHSVNFAFFLCNRFFFIKKHLVYQRIRLLLKSFHAYFSNFSDLVPLNLKYPKILKLI